MFLIVHVYVRVSHRRTVSATSTLTILSEDFVKRVVEDVDNADLATEDLVRKASRISCLFPTSTW